MTDLPTTTTIKCPRCAQPLTVPLRVGDTETDPTGRLWVRLLIDDDGLTRVCEEHLPVCVPPPTIDTIPGQCLMCGPRGGYPGPRGTVIVCPRCGGTGRDPARGSDYYMDAILPLQLPDRTD